jgi:site-specific DNA-methyltransferase (adenine-specific)
MKNQVIQGDCLEVMKTMAEKSVDMVLTSPPYDNLRTYNGYTFDFEGIAKELFRVVKDGGVCVWVVGDATIKGSETGTSFKQALYFKEIGFNLHDTMIWRKTDPPPQTKEGRRYTLCHEYMFVFSKGKINTFNPIMIPTKNFGKKANIGTQRDADGSKREDRLLAMSNRMVMKTKPMQSVVEYPTGKNKEHPAVFPEKLAEDHILSWSNEGDTILDPMAGSGTTLKMAKKNNRNYIGIEISPEYINIINQRLTNI